MSGINVVLATFFIMLASAFFAAKGYFWMMTAKHDRDRSVFEADRAKVEYETAEAQLADTQKTLEVQEKFRH